MAKRQYNKKSEYWEKIKNPNKPEEIKKAGNTDQVTSRLKLGEIGTTALSTINIYSRFIKDYDCCWPRSLDIYEEMSKDADVATALRANYLFVERAFDEFEIRFKKDSPASESAAKFVEWALKNMESQTLRQVVRDILSYKVHGFSVIEKVYSKITDGEYAGKYKIKKLAPRPQTTLRKNRPFRFSDDGRDILGIYQYIPQKFSFSQTELSTLIGEIYIPRNKFMLFGEQITDTNPVGVSPLSTIYVPWKEKCLISEYEVVGVGKDMAGMPVLEVPTDILNKAYDEPGSPEAQSIAVLTQNMASMHAGDQSYMIIPSDPHEGSNSLKQYSIRFMGVDGSGKQFDTKALKEERKKDIYDSFGAGFLIMGNSENGSYSLSDNKQTLHSHFIEHDVLGVSEVFNKDLIPQFLALNGIYLSDEDMPVFVAGNVGDPEIEANSKMIQRVVAVGALPLTPEVLNEILMMCGFKYQIPDEVITDESKIEDFLEKFLPKAITRSGDGMAQGTSGNGTSTASAFNDNSSLNLDNAS